MKKGTVMGKRIVTRESFESPESESIAGADYDPNTRTLTIHFQTGTTYEHDGFPATGTPSWDEFKKASSKGRYHAQMIRPMFAGVKK